MLVTFRTPAYADITMFGDVALALIESMGHSPSVPGALAAEDVPEALQRLRQAVEAKGGVVLPTVPDDDSRSREEGVSLAHRALPLMKLLEAAAEAEAYVMWDR
ncbi:DUF1840 domain-containing protein [Thioalkalivibrio sp.]|uniref:DUF1840 domain-containing protein n=1 Tax=Thioalkalivibrio sp. TaxID=2093813 RepID=UPI003975ACA6